MCETVADRDNADSHKFAKICDAVLLKGGHCAYYAISCEEASSMSSALHHARCSWVGPLAALLYAFLSYAE